MSTNSLEKRPARAIALLHRVEDAVLALLLTAMILLAPLQIFLRNFFDAGIAWADPLLRVLVLWVGLLGALAASRAGRHITIDVVSRVLPERWSAAIRVVTSLFAASVSGLVAWHAARFAVSEFVAHSTAFAGIPAWALVSIVPFAFGMIALRFLLQVGGDASRLLRPDPAAT